MALVGAGPPVGWRGALVLLGTRRDGGVRVHDTLDDVIDISRNFYGVLRVREYGRDDPTSWSVCSSTAA